LDDVASKIKKDYSSELNKARERFLKKKYDKRNYTQKDFAKDQ
jgi:hypothetical protein